MALKKCKECGHEVSTTAKTCPHCGAKPNKGIGCLGVIGVFIFIVILANIFDSKEDKKDVAVVKKPPTREERIERGFSAWDGSHRRLEQRIKESMNDPKSYEHVETTYWDKGSYLLVKTSFRGKNAFGGTVVNWVEAKVDLDGNVLEILSQGP